MNRVVYYSNTGESRAVAEYLSAALQYPLADVESSNGESFENLVLVFPVYCQNIPRDVKDFLKRVDVKNLTAVATYGKMCHGNVLYEIQNTYKKSMVAGAYLPSKHSYIENDESFRDYEKLTPLVEKIKKPRTVILPRAYKNPLANLFPKMRSIMVLKIYKNTDCDGCNICGDACPRGAIERGVTSHKCIRCVRCVRVCPRKALKIKLSLPLRLYLRKKKVNKTEIYV